MGLWSEGPRVVNMAFFCLSACIKCDLPRMVAIVRETCFGSPACSTDPAMERIFATPPHPYGTQRLSFIARGGMSGLTSYKLGSRRTVQRFSLAAFGHKIHSNNVMSICLKILLVQPSEAPDTLEVIYLLDSCIGCASLPRIHIFLENTCILPGCQPCKQQRRRWQLG